SGAYASVMAAFCQWAAPQMPALPKVLKARSEEHRRSFPGGHARLPVMLADLLASFELFIRFVLDTTGEEVLSAEHADDLVRRCADALREAGESQGQYQKASEPTARFLELVGSALASGRAHVAGSDGRAPDNPGAWGWRLEKVGAVEEWRSHGDRIGWVDGADLYLEPGAAYRTAQMQAGQGEGLAVSDKMLRRRLHDKHLLKSIDEKRESLVIRRVLDGTRRNVLHLSASLIDGTPDVEEEISA
ncbi:MAG TPA: hypothetical protein VHC70_10075, partial [Phycisphaerales bacterium]|nr:hypothetical protein [Phycisphaerales bacterium]